MRTRIQAGGREVVVTRNSCGWKVEAGVSRARGRYLDDALEGALPALRQRERERLVVDLLESRNDRTRRLRAQRRGRALADGSSLGQLLAAARSARGLARETRGHARALHRQSEELAQRTQRLAVRIERLRDVRASE